MKTKRLPRKQRVPWMLSRLRRLYWVVGKTDAQLKRVEQLEAAVVAAGGELQ